MVARTQIARRRFLTAMAGISATLVAHKASANSVDWRNLSGNDADSDDRRRSGFRLSGSRRRRPSRGGRPHTLCFLEGTKLATPSGDHRVEDLNVGQLVLTVSGEAKAIKWVGQCQRRPDAAGVWTSDTQPITVEAHAIAENVPSQDLHLSPEHALYIDGILIPAKHLVNGITIYPMNMRDIEAVNYYHVELDVHDAVWAEGAPAETYRDSGQRSTFDKTDTLVGFEPGQAETEPFAPLVALHGRRANIISHLRSAGSLLVDLRGQFEVTRDRISERAFTLEEARSFKIAA